MSSGLSSVPILLLDWPVLPPDFEFAFPLPPAAALASLIVLPAFGGSNLPLHLKHVTLKVLSVGGKAAACCGVGAGNSRVVRQFG